MLQIFTVYDEKAMCFMPPFFVPAMGLATRTFSDCINSADHHFGKHPADYTLFKLGVFDDATGEFILEDKKSMGNGVEFRNPDKPESADGPSTAPILPNEAS